MSSSRNKTLTLTPEDEARLTANLQRLTRPATVADITDGTFCQDLEEALTFMPTGFADLLVLDPPYNLSIQFGDLHIARQSDEDYLQYLMRWMPATLRLLKPCGSVYVCCDWLSSTTVYQALKQCGVTLRNRITWQREKGRGAKDNWKNAMEDIWYGVVNPRDFYFDVEAVKQRRRVIAPYRTAEGQPKDWEETEAGRFRLTCPGNFWDDISIPYWSMAENTPHPTQKPEKLVAKLILASCPAGGIVVDPFLGSGTTSVTARKLGRHFVGIEQNAQYAAWALKRLEMAETDSRIQGFADGCFWERNSGK